MRWFTDSPADVTLTERDGRRMATALLAAETDIGTADDRATASWTSNEGVGRAPRERVGEGDRLKDDDFDIPQDEARVLAFYVREKILEGVPLGLACIQAIKEHRPTESTVDILAARGLQAFADAAAVQRTAKQQRAREQN